MEWRRERGEEIEGKRRKRKGERGEKSRQAYLVFCYQDTSCVKSGLYLPTSLNCNYLPKVLYPQSHWGEKIQSLTYTTSLALAFGLPSFTLLTAHDKHDGGAYLCHRGFLFQVPICSRRSPNKHLLVTSTVVNESCRHPCHCGLYRAQTFFLVFMCLQFFSCHSSVPLFSICLQTLFPVFTTNLFLPLFLKKFFLFILCDCFTCVCVCSPCTRLVLEEVQLSATGVKIGCESPYGSRN